MSLDCIQLPLAAVLVLVIAGLIYYLCIINFPWGKHIIRDVSHPLPLLNADDAEIRLLARLGFNGLGILEFRYFWQTRKPHALWYYVDGAATTCAEIGQHPFDQKRALVRLFSWFPDSALLETFYDYGETIDQPDYNVRFAAYDLERAYVSHRTRLATFVEQHGNPVVFHDVKPLISYHAIDAKRYRQHRLRRTTRIGLLILLLMLMALGILALSRLVDQWLASLLIMTVGLSVCGFLLALVLRAFRYPAGALDA